MNDESRLSEEKKEKLEVIKAKVGGKVVLKCGIKAAESSNLLNSTFPLLLSGV